MLSENDIANAWYTPVELGSLKTRARYDARAIISQNEASRECRKRSRAGDVLFAPTGISPLPGDKVPAPTFCMPNYNEKATVNADGEEIDHRGLEHWLGSDRKRQRCRTIRAVLGAQDKLRIHLGSLPSLSAEDTGRAAAALAVYSRRRTRCAAEAARCAGHVDFFESFKSFFEMGNATDMVETKIPDNFSPLTEEVVVN